MYKKNEVIFEEDIKILKLDIMLRDNALTKLRKKFEKAKKERDDLKLTLEKFENSSKNLSKLLEIQVSDKFKTGEGYDSQVFDSQVFDSQVNDKYKTGEGYHAVPPPYTGNFMPPKPNLVLADEEEYVFSESITSISDSEDENETEFKYKQRKPSFAKVEFVKSNEHVKIPRESVDKVENNKQAKYPRKNSQSPRGIENLIDLKVKVIRCDNGTEFKNKVMNQFCEMKGIKREFSVARTLQQNGVAERKNKTLIEAARTMLADSKLPTTFWAEAVNTACYVQNRVLVIKPHNKTPYELFLGRKHALSFMRPFGCPVTILNTIDHLGKFDGKADEGFFVGYSTNSKAFRVFNSRTRIVEENLHVKFSTKACENAGKTRVEIVHGKDYILLPFLTQDPPFSSSLKDSPDAEFKPSGEEENKDTEHLKNEDSEVPNTEEPRVNQEKDKNVNSTNIINIVSSTVNTASIMDNVLKSNNKADMNNLDTFITVSPILTTKDHKDYPFEQIIRDLHLAPQTRRMTKSVIEHDDIIFGSTKKSLCTEFEKLMHKKFQVSSIGELTFFLGLQVTQKNNGIFISQDKYVDEILKKFGFSTVKTASTPMETSKPLLKDVEAEDINVHLYRSMIGSLMYLTASKHDIMFALCACARFQVIPKVSHLHAEIHNRGCQFLGRRLISWQCKKQTIVANSTTEVEYVVAASCCGQVLWIQNQMLDYGYNFMNTKIFIDNESTICIVKNPVFHSKTKHIEIRHHFIKDSNEKKLIQMIKIHTDHNVADLLTKAFDVGRFQYLIASI
ncbi:uncharacterized mitochondrial protein-like protein [Tanacetum coccineum]